MNLLALVTRLDKLKAYQTSTTKLYPGEAAGVTATANGAGGFAKGTYAQISSGLVFATRYKPTAIIVTNASAVDEYEIDLATGAAASEVLGGTFKVTGNGRYPITFAEVAEQTRIAVRIGCLDGVARTLEIGIEFIDGLT